jgi:cyanate permease
MFSIAILSFLIPGANRTPSVIGLVFALYLITIGLLGEFAIRVADLAEQKGRNWKSFFWLSIFVSPLITWLIVSAMRSDTSKLHLKREISTAEELAKLVELYKEGVLSEDEYEKAKKLILRIRD